MEDWHKHNSLHDCMNVSINVNSLIGWFVNLKSRDDHIACFLICQERDKSGGTLRSIANFFKSLGPNSRAKNSSQSSSTRGGVEMNGGHTMSRGSLPLQSQSRIQATGSRNSSYSNSGWSSSQHLPPIDNSRKSPHLQPQSPRLLASSSSDLLSLTAAAAAAENESVQQLLAKDVEELK